MKKCKISESKVFGQSVVESSGRTKNSRSARYESYKEFLSSSDVVDLSKKLKPLAKRIHEKLSEKLPYLSHILKRSLNLFRIQEMLYEIVLYGDWFGEIVEDPVNLHLGPLWIQALPVHTMYRIESIKGKLIEYQQSFDGVDYSVISNPITETSQTSVRFSPDQIIHIRMDCGKYYPYGTSRLEQMPFKGTPFLLGEPSLEDIEEQVVESFVSTLGA